jgi:hypothetical protein
MSGMIIQLPDEKASNFHSGPKLGHASPNTVMIYAKLYPGQFVEEYRKTVRSLYNVYYGE